MGNGSMDPLSKVLRALLKVICTSFPILTHLPFCLAKYDLMRKHLQHSVNRMTDFSKLALSLVLSVMFARPMENVSMAIPALHCYKHWISRTPWVSIFW